jgi:hypothetical protein
MGCRHADFTNNHATPQPEAGLRPKDFQALSAQPFNVGLCQGLLIASLDVEMF